MPRFLLALISIRSSRMTKQSHKTLGQVVPSFHHSGLLEQGRKCAWLPDYNPKFNPEDRLNVDLKSSPWAKRCRFHPIQIALYNLQLMLI